AGGADADDLAAVVDVIGDGDLGAGCLEDGDPVPVQQVPVCGGDITGPAGDLAPVVDPGGAPRREGPEPALLPQEPVEGAVGGLVLADQLAAVADVAGRAACRAGVVAPEVRGEVRAG